MLDSLEQPEILDEDDRTIVEIAISLVGTTPLVMHNIQLANPDCEWTRAIAAITSNAKQKKTEEGRREIARLEWFGGLYTEKGVVGVPSINVKRTLQEGAKATKRGKDIVRALMPAEVFCPLVYSGPKETDKLQRKPEFSFTTMVGVGKNKVLRTRPQFISWKLATTWTLDLNIIDLDDMQGLVETAGRMEGLGDARVLGKGRFTGEVKKL